MSKITLDLDSHSMMSFKDLIKKGKSTMPAKAQVVKDFFAKNPLDTPPKSVVEKCQQQYPNLKFTTHDVASVKSKINKGLIKLDKTTYNQAKTPKDTYQIIFGLLEDQAGGLKQLRLSMLQYLLKTEDD